MGHRTGARGSREFRCGCVSYRAYQNARARIRRGIVAEREASKIFARTSYFTSDSRCEHFCISRELPTETVGRSSRKLFTDTVMARVKNESASCRCSRVLSNVFPFDEHCVYRRQNGSATGEILRETGICDCVETNVEWY